MAMLGRVVRSSPGLAAVRRQLATIPMAANADRLLSVQNYYGEVLQSSKDLKVLPLCTCTELANISPTHRVSPASIAPTLLQQVAPGHEPARSALCANVRVGAIRAN